MKLILLLFPLFLLSACSRLEWGFRFADTLVFYQLDDYFDLGSESKSSAQDEFNRSLDVIKREQFGKVAKRLEEFAEESLKQSLSQKGFLIFLDENEDTFRESIRSFEKMAQTLVNAEAQTDFRRFDKKFLEKFNEDTKEIQENRKSRLQKERDRAMDIVKETISYLTEEQKKDFEETLTKNPPPFELQLQSRKAVFENFKSQRSDPKTRTAFVKQFMEDWASLQTPEYREAREKYRIAMRALSYRIYASLNKDQKETLKKSFKGRAKELRAIAAKAK